MGVEAGGDDEELRLELAERFREFRPESLDHCFVTASRGERHVQVRAFARALAGDFRRAARPRVERVLVGGEKEHAGILQEDRLRAIAVVHVPIDDHYALKLVLFLRVAGGDGGVREKTETLRPVRHRMMSRRAQRREGVLHPAFHDQIHRRQRARHRPHRNLVAAFRNRRVGAAVHVFSTRRACPLELRHVVRVVRSENPRHGIDFLVRRNPQQAPGNGMLPEMVCQAAQAIRILGEAFAGIVLEKQIIMDERCAEGGGFFGLDHGG